MLASLVTWHVDDPSFSYAIDGPAHNLLGRPGAAFADLAMQFFGFAVVGIVFPLALSGWNLFACACRAGRSASSSPGSPARCCWRPRSPACRCCEQWPLPTGLGGAAGDLVLGFAEWFGGGALSGGLYAALFVVLVGLSLGLLWASCLLAAVGRCATRAARQTAAAAADEDEEDAEESASAAASPPRRHSSRIGR